MEKMLENVTAMLDHAVNEPDNLLALLSRYRVVIPAIQRHYVQGADTPQAKEVRTNFVRDLLGACQGDGKPLTLDFVYGPIDTTGADAFIPVDGQQRLTTLWLLYRYAAECVKEESVRRKLLNLLARFSYSGRVFATRFCEAFTDTGSRWDVHKSPRAGITRAPWFNPS